MTQEKTLGPRLFTLEEAAGLLPVIRDRLGRFQDIYAQYDSCRKDLSVLRLVSSSGGDPENPDTRRLLDLEQHENDLLARMRVLQNEVLATGCVPKSFREGLIDFFALKDGHLVFLCWKQGEDTIEAWHTLEGGFSGRMPIALFEKDETRRDAEETD